MDSYEELDKGLAAQASEQPYRDLPAAAGAELKSLRDVIDAADHALLAALGQRLAAVAKVGALKGAYDLPIYQQERWQAVIADRVALGRQLGLSEEFTRALLELICEESVRIQQRKRP